MGGNTEAERAARMALHRPLSLQQPRSPDRGRFSLNERLEYLKRYGSHCMAYSTLQPGMSYFDLPGVGYLAYMAVRSLLVSMRPLRVVLSDPIAAPSDHLLLLSHFLSGTSGTVFVQASKQFAAALAERGLVVNQMGIETDLPIASFDLCGNRKAQLRHWVNKAQKEGVIAEECSLETISGPEITRICGEWLRRKGGKELVFLMRPFIPSSEVDCRYFRISQNGRLLGFACYDPLYQHNTIYGYYQNHMRYANDIPHGAFDLLTVTALKTFREEGRSRLSLGMSPLAGLEHEEFPHNRLTTWALGFLYRHGNVVYPFRGAASHKKKFAGQATPVYFASTRGTTIRDVLAVIAAIRTRTQCRWSPSVDGVAQTTRAIPGDVCPKSSRSVSREPL